MAQQEMSYASALNEAKQVIIQQSSRIKGDLEKIKGQQQTIVEQAARITETEARMEQLSDDYRKLGDELRALEIKFNDSEAARQQAEGVVNRQGERINNFETQVAELTAELSSANNQIADLTRERDDLRIQLPTNEDVEALNDMMTLLSQKQGNASSAESNKPRMRMAEAA